MSFYWTMKLQPLRRIQFGPFNYTIVDARQLLQGQHRRNITINTLAAGTCTITLTNVRLLL
jgi:hypothetical protein